MTADSSRSDAIGDKIEELLLENGPMEVDKIVDELSQDRPYVYQALVGERFVQDDTGRVCINDIVE